MKQKFFRKVFFGFSAAALSCLMVLSGMLPIFSHGKEEAAAKPEVSESIKDVTGKTDLNLKDYLNTSVTQKLTENIAPDREISVMITVDVPTVLDGYEALGDTSMEIADFSVSREGASIRKKIERENTLLQSELIRKGIDYKLGVTYDTLMSGFEAVIKAGDFEKLQKAVGNSANVFISDEYEECVTYDVVENKVNVHDTGIFNSDGSQYDGSGTVIAVLDSGLDYTHDVFDPSRFNGEEVMTQTTLRDKVPLLTAAQRTPGLTAADVYINRKVPYAYDYADSDPDVYPINSDHGTHVSGIIVGQADPKYENDGIDDNYIRGVAPNAQLAFFKVFSESNSSAKQSWIVAALEDCVTLGVDVINMSLGSGSGFTREVDDSMRAEVYDSVKEHGISLVCAAANEGSAAQGSEKNGSLPLATNPDTGTVGSPATYDSSMAVASISGVKTPYMLLDGELIYFTNARNFAGEERKFVEEILNPDEQERVFEYVIIPGIGSQSDYGSVGDLTGKIAIVQRGVTQFEEKSQLAKDHGAAGCIIYNNLSGDIAMTIGNTEFPTCSIDRDNGKKFLDKSGTVGKVTISRSQVAGPFMSDFSSWGPTPDLHIKPEITAHGGDILSSLPGQRYDRYNGTSMASPNQAGLTALVRQYVKEHFTNLDALGVTAMVNQLMMSTADIALNPNGIPFAVRRQGAGLANLTKATSTPAYLRTYDETGAVNDKTKLELGDDPEKTGEYSFSFEIVNISGESLSYDVSALVQTEGISEEFTPRGATTITEKGYVLSGARMTVQSVQNGSNSGNTVTVGAGATAVVSATITLSDSDKEYMDSKFANGIYVEGYVKLTSKNGKNDLNVPFLKFYGSWTKAPIFDLDYFETYADENNDSIETEKKTLADFVATRPIGTLYGDYISYLGSFPYLTDPNSSLVMGADKEKIAFTNQEGEYGGINGLGAIWFGMLRPAKKIDISITDSSTGEVIWTKSQGNVIKSYYNTGGGSHVWGQVATEFKVREYNLKNNTRYDVKAVAYLDYDDGGINDNVKNVFEFPFYTDFESPVATGVEYTYEYDYDTKTNRLFANVSIYENHYLMGYIAGAISENEDFDPNKEDSYLFTTDTFSSYVTPVLGQRNTTNVIQIELTDYLDQIKESHDGRSFIIQCMDYAMNTATYEFYLPDEITQITFPEMQPDENGVVPGVRISPNELYRLNPETVPAQDQAWRETIQYTSSDENVVKIVDGQLLGVNSGRATVTATSPYKNAEGVQASTTLDVTVLSPGDEGYTQYDKPTVEEFYLDGFWANKVFYTMDNTDRGLGLVETYNDSGERNYMSFGKASEVYVSMYPSESVQLNPVVHGYYGADRYRIRYSSSNSAVVDVDQDGNMTAKNVRIDGDGKEIPLNTQRTATVSINLDVKGDDGEWKSTFYTLAVSITVKKPYYTASGYLLSYKGLGGEVDIPASLKLTTINPFAFSNYEYVDKDLEAGDIIDEEDNFSMKQWFIGDNSITKVIVPEGVESIENYAFAGLTALKEVVLPSTLYKLQIGAFYGCTSLEKVSFSSENNLKFVNECCFYGCKNLSTFDFKSMVGIGKSAFEGTGLMNITLPITESIGTRAFARCESLNSVTMEASSVKFGSEAFLGCIRLSSINVNAKVIPSGTFDSCTQLTNVTLGRDVEVIGQYAFRFTKVTSFVVDQANKNFTAKDNGQYLIDSDGKLALVAPTVTTFKPNDSSITTVGTGAFSTAGDKLISIELPSVTVVEDYAFANCNSLSSINLGNLTSVGEGAFRGTGKLKKLPNFAEGATIGAYAFAESGISSVNLSNIASIGEYAFANSSSLSNVTIGDGIKIGDYAFFGAYSLSEVKIGNDCEIGTKAFAAMHITEFYKMMDIVIDDTNAYFGSGTTFKYNNNDMTVYFRPHVSSLSTLSIGNNAKIGDRAFYYAGSSAIRVGGTTSTGSTISDLTIVGSLKEVTLGSGASIGDYAFYGCKDLASVKGLEQATYIGDYAFAGEDVGSLLFSNGVLEVNKILSCAQFETLDLSAAEFIGKGAFAGNQKLKSVKLGSIEKLGISSQFGVEKKKVYVVDPLADTIDAGVFDGCTALAEINLGGLLEIGENAFRGTALTTADLREGVKLGEGVFENVKTLTSASNLNKAVEIGGYAFYGTSIPAADISDVVLLGDFAFGFSTVKSVTFGNSIETLGENPFAGCEIEDYTRDGSNTFDIGSKGVKVVGSALYRPNTNGYELISFPMKKNIKDFEVMSKTNRIGARAFYGSGIEVVTLAREVSAIGHMAFYNCDKLLLVTFRSINAPRLEEEFDFDYETAITEFGTNKYVEEAFGKVLLNFVDGSSRMTGLEYIDATMWSPAVTCVFYGANFIYGVTDERHNDRTLIMVRPSNGVGYETFSYNMYFDQVVIGRGAISDSAQAVIDMLGSLPESLRAEDRDQVYAIYDLYNTLSMEDQNYLTAEGFTMTLSNAKRLVDSMTTTNPGTEPENPPAEPNNTALYVVLGIVGGGLVIALVVYFVKRKSNGEDGSDDASENKTE